MTHTISSKRRPGLSRRPPRRDRMFPSLLLAVCAASAFMASSAQAACLPPPPGLAAWYPFDGNGTDLILGNTAAPTGAISYPAAMVQRGLRVTSTGFMAIPARPEVNQGLGDFSIDFWLYVPKAWITKPTLLRTLIDKRVALISQNSGQYAGYSIYVVNRRLGLQLSHGAPINFGQTAPAPMLTEGWNHVAVTVDRDNTLGLLFYRNGVITATANPTSRTGNLNNNAATLVGHNVFNHGATSTEAAFDELEFFHRVLQPAEVAAIFQAGPDGKCK